MEIKMRNYLGWMCGCLFVVIGAVMVACGGDAKPPQTPGDAPMDHSTMGGMDGGMHMDMDAAPHKH